jgi:hypothetical protein
VTWLTRQIEKSNVRIAEILPRLALMNSPVARSDVPFGFGMRLVAILRLLNGESTHERRPTRAVPVQYQCTVAQEREHTCSFSFFGKVNIWAKKFLKTSHFLWCLGESRTVHPFFIRKSPFLLFFKYPSTNCRPGRWLVQKKP